MRFPLVAEYPLPQAFESLASSVRPPSDSAIRVAAVPYQAGDTECEGFLALDVNRPTPRPAVLLLHAWNGVGHSIQMRARMLARLGYVAFAADLYGRGVRPQSPDAARQVSSRYYDDLPLLVQRVADGLDALVEVTGVQPAQVTVAGYCFGGTAALEFARTAPRVASVVSFHGLLFPHEESAAETSYAPLLVVTGGDDELVPDHAVAQLMTELRSSRRSWEIDVHGQAPHAFTVPGTDRFRPDADRRSWDRFRRFLAETNPLAPAT